MSQLLSTAPDDKHMYMTVSVRGQPFKILWHALVQFKRSVFCEALRQHEIYWKGQGDNGSGRNKPLIIHGNPKYFELISEYLHNPSSLPIVEGTPQLQWLEREAVRYNLVELETLCQDAYKRLNTVDVMQLLNGQKNMSGMDLRHLDLCKIDFSGASFYRAQLDGAKLDYSNFSGDNTNVSFASFEKCKMNNTIFSESMGHEGKFNECACQESNFNKFDGSNADFAKSDLRKSTFIEANLVHANLSDANLQGVDLRGLLTVRC